MTSARSRPATDAHAAAARIGRLKLCAAPVRVLSTAAGAMDFLQCRERFGVRRKPHQHLRGTPAGFFQKLRIVGLQRQSPEQPMQLWPRSAALLLHQFQRLHREFHPALRAVDPSQLAQHFFGLGTGRANAHRSLEVRHRTSQIAAVFANFGNPTVQRRFRVASARLSDTTPSLRAARFAADELECIGESLERVTVRRQLCEQAAADPDHHFQAVLSVELLVSTQKPLVAQRHHPSQNAESLGFVGGNACLLAQSSSCRVVSPPVRPAR